MADDTTERMLRNAEAGFHQNVASLGRALRDLADRVEREGELRDGPVMGTPAGAWAAQHVVRAVTWGVANLNLDVLINRAADVDALRQEISTGSVVREESDEPA